MHFQITIRPDDGIYRCGGLAARCQGSWGVAVVPWGSPSCLLVGPVVLCALLRAAAKRDSGLLSSSRHTCGVRQPAPCTQHGLMFLRAAAERLCCCPCLCCCRCRPSAGQGGEVHFRLLHPAGVPARRTEGALLDKGGAKGDGCFWVGWPSPWDVAPGSGTRGPRGARATAQTCCGRFFCPLGRRGARFCCVGQVLALQQGLKECSASVRLDQSAPTLAAPTSRLVRMRRQLLVPTMCTSVTT